MDFSQKFKIVTSKIAILIFLLLENVFFNLKIL